MGMSWIKEAVDETGEFRCCIAKKASKKAKAVVVEGQPVKEK